MYLQLEEERQLIKHAKFPGRFNPPSRAYIFASLSSSKVGATRTESVKVTFPGELRRESYSCLHLHSSPLMELDSVWSLGAEEGMTRNVERPGNN